MMQCYNISEPEQEVFMGTDKARYTVSVDQKMFQEMTALTNAPSGIIINSVN